MKSIKTTLVIALCAAFGNVGVAQFVFDPVKGCNIDGNGDCVTNTVLSAMPFLRIIPDARSGAMGDAGIAISPTSNAMHFNASNLAFSDNDFGLSTTFTPWLTNLGLNDVYLAYLSGYKTIDDMETVGASLRYFSLGEINFTDVNGTTTGMGRPRELEASVAYARKLSPDFSAGITAKYIYSNLAAGQQTEVGSQISAANAFATDLSVTWNKDLDLTSYNSALKIGACISNLGSKVSYTRNEVKDFLPANLGIGAALDLEFDEFNKLTFAIDFNKLLLPTPTAYLILDENGDEIQNPEWSTDGDDIADYRQKSLFEGVFGSFGDAQGGFSEEIQEISISTAVEYWYASQFAIRAGYFYENEFKGDRQFLTVGFGLKYNVYGFNLSYLVPTNNQRGPLDNTLRFTLNIDIE
jgi:hypothetical protein